MQLILARVSKFSKEISEFPITTNHIGKEWFNPGQVVQHFNATYPIVHGAVIDVLNNFILMKVSDFF